MRYTCGCHGNELKRRPAANRCYRCFQCVVNCWLRCVEPCARLESSGVFVIVPPLHIFTFMHVCILVDTVSKLKPPNACKWFRGQTDFIHSNCISRQWKVELSTWKNWFDHMRGWLSCGSPWKHQSVPHSAISCATDFRLSPLSVIARTRMTIFISIFIRLTLSFIRDWCFMSFLGHHWNGQGCMHWTIGCFQLAKRAQTHGMQLRLRLIISVFFLCVFSCDIQLTSEELRCRIFWF